MTRNDVKAVKKKDRHRSHSTPAVLFLGAVEKFMELSVLFGNLVIGRCLPAASSMSQFSSEKACRAI